MKYSSPEFSTVESKEDVQKVRDVKGEVLNIGECQMWGIVEGEPTGIRRFPNEVAAYEAFVSMELGYPVKIERADPELLEPVKTKPIKPKVKKAKPAVKKLTGKEAAKAAKKKAK